jgi:hypothetical protein
VDVREEDGKRTITKTGVYQGVELQLLAGAPHHDTRLPPRPDAPHLDFSRELREVEGDAEWQEVGGLGGRSGAGACGAEGAPGRGGCWALAAGAACGHQAFC